MLHEAHTGPLASLFYNPRTRYYGAATPSSFYPVVVSELWRWTGNKSLIAPLIKPALRGLRWKDKYTDLFGDGFYAYRTLSSQGNKNQGWKDSGDAIVYPDGRQVDTPISTCEEQGFVYVAKVRMSEMLWFMGRRELARRLFDEASELKKRFNERFWMPRKEVLRPRARSGAAADKIHQLKSWALVDLWNSAQRLRRAGGAAAATA